MRARKCKLIIVNHCNTLGTRRICFKVVIAARGSNENRWSPQKCIQMHRARATVKMIRHAQAAVDMLACALREEQKVRIMKNHKFRVNNLRPHDMTIARNIYTSDFFF